MVYRVDLSPAAQRELRGIDSGARDRILRALAKLENEPRPAGAKKLKGRDELWPFGSAIIGSFTRFANRFSFVGRPGRSPPRGVPMSRRSSGHSQVH